MFHPWLKKVWLQLHRLPRGGGFVRGEDDFVSLDCVIQARQWHLFAFLERIKERLELCRVGVVRHVPGIEHLHRKIAPRVFVQAAEFH